MYVVSVCMLAYNHESFIEQAIESIFNQAINFTIELVITNDCSTDNTHKKIENYIKCAPANVIVKYYNHTENLGMVENFEFSLKKCTGKFLAMCEGDDYWVDSLKLQQQVRFLEENQEYNLVTGSVRQYIQNSNTFIDSKKTASYTFTYKDMIVKNQCATCATLIRNFIIKEPEFKLIQDKGTDSQLWIRALGQHGKGKFTANTVAVYRKHDTSATGIRKKDTSTFQKGNDFMQRKIVKAQFWDAYYGNKAKKSVLLVKHKIYKKMTTMGFYSKNYMYAFNFFLKYIWVKTNLFLLRTS